MLSKDDRQKNKSNILMNFLIVYQRKGEDYTRDGYINAHDEKEAEARFIEMLEHQSIEAEILSVKEEEDY
jgi:hypothetical protein